MSIHDDIQEMLPALALGALEKEDASRAEAHLATCQLCTRVLEDYTPVAHSLALAVPMYKPPQDLKARTMRRALGERQPSRALQSTPPPQRPWWRIWFAPSFAAAALVVAIVAFGFTVWQTSQLVRQVEVQKDLMTVVAYAQGEAQVVRGTTRAPDAVGRLYLDPDSSVAALVTVNMPPLSDDRVYQVWLTEPDGTKVSGGFFRLDSEGSGWILVRGRQHLGDYVQVGVTNEPAGGSTTPTTDPVLLARFNPQ